MNDAPAVNVFGYVSGEGHRWWIDPACCSHENNNVCKSCDFDRYYAQTYPSCPWGPKAAAE